MELLEGIGWFRDHTLSKPTMRAKTIIREDAHLCAILRTAPCFAATGVDSRGFSTIDFFTISYLYDENSRNVVLKTADETVVSNTVFPQSFETRS